MSLNKLLKTRNEEINQQSAGLQKKLADIQQALNPPAEQTAKTSPEPGEQPSTSGQTGNETSA